MRRFLKNQLAAFHISYGADKIIVKNMLYAGGLSKLYCNSFLHGTILYCSEIDMNNKHCLIVKTKTIVSVIFNQR